MDEIRSPTAFPDDAALAAGLATVLSDADRSGGTVRLVNRRRNDYASTFPSEMVSYRRADGGVGRLFCKYMIALPDDHRDHGSRGGVAYEAIVYERALARLDVTVPAYRGTVRDPLTGGVWLVLEDVGDADRLTSSSDPTAMIRAAIWLGRFHAAQAERLAAAGPPPGLNIYHAEDYRGWARRAAAATRSWRNELPWLADLPARFEEVIALLTAAEPAVIHGEYYPRNILVHGGEIYPVDWESAAVAAGELDLAMLCDGWPAEDAEKCRAAYAAARWPAGPPPAFARTADAADLSVQVRWIGVETEWPVGGPLQSDLPTAAARFGWCSPPGADG